MYARKNKVLSKVKIRIVEPDNIQDKTPDEVIIEPKANSEPNVGSEPEASSSLGKASPSPDNIIPDPDMGMDLKPAS